MERKTVLIATGAALAVAVGIGGTVVHQEVNERNEAATTSHASLTYEADFSDDANLAGAAEDLFYGKVTALKGQKNLGVGPESQYAVEVQRVFKGDVTGVVVVNQQGGKDENGDIVNLPEGDALLEVGKRYLFATKYNRGSRPWPSPSGLLSLVGADDALLTPSSANRLVDVDLDPPWSGTRSRWRHTITALRTM
ncbi:hypothetical protein [Streptomyces sp. NPDC050416]|uniref:hypothetical protein n=1 Tax=Streptomyces sp. NPDC050416 TaxID=3365611 RepID=UPI0037BD4BDD